MESGDRAAPPTTLLWDARCSFSTRAKTGPGRPGLVLRSKFRARGCCEWAQLARTFDSLQSCAGRQESRTLFRSRSTLFAPFSPQPIFIPPRPQPRSCLRPPCSIFVVATVFSLFFFFPAGISLPFGLSFLAFSFLIHCLIGLTSRPDPSHHPRTAVRHSHSENLPSAHWHSILCAIALSSGASQPLIQRT